MRGPKSQLSYPNMIWPVDDTHLDRAAQRLRAGGVVGVPTETVYGLAAAAGSAAGVAAIYRHKGRPAINPLIVHADSLDMVRALVELPALALKLAAAFWPGPLTLVLPRRPGVAIAPAALAGLDSVAVRVPAHAVMTGLIQRLGTPIVAPSANRSGRLSATRAAHVDEDFGGEVPVLDGGDCCAGIESTIVSLLGDTPALLRPGALASGQIEAMLGRPLAAPTSTIIAPGMLLRHYAPRARLRLNAAAAVPGESMLGFGGTPGADLDLSPAGDLAEAATNLFAMLRALDDGREAIAVAPIPAHGLGIAINDRLRRAAQSQIE